MRFDDLLNLESTDTASENERKKFKRFISKKFIKIVSDLCKFCIKMPVAKRVAVHINVSHRQSNFPLVIFKKKVSVFFISRKKFAYIYNADYNIT